MFKKLVSNLPFNPSSIDQLAFYGRRLKREKSVRKIGLIFIILAFLVQFAAIISPPKQAAANPNGNDLIPGGFTSQQQAISDCQNDVNYYAVVLAHYDISCADLSGPNASTISLVSTDTNYGGALWSAGFQQYGLSNETPDTINTNLTLYWRPLHDWDTFGYSTYTALRFKNNTGKTFFVLFSCGNLVSVGFPAPPPKPNLTINKTTIPGAPVSGSTVKPGTVLGYRMYFDNTGSGAANLVDLTDALPAHTTFVSMGAGTSSHTFHSTPGSPFIGQPVSQYAEWIENSMPGNTANYYVDLTLQIDTNTANGTNICNTAIVRAVNNSPVTSNAVCFKVLQTAKPPIPTPPKPPPPIKCSVNCLVFSKSAENLTEHISNANSTTAQAGDIIQYTLNVKDVGKVSVKGFLIQESLTDVLVYANPLNLEGGTLNSNQEISWPKVDIASGKSVQKTFTVQVKNPIPQNPPNVADPAQYDMVMTNTYGNTININLPKSVVQSAQQISQTLPNTGPGTGIFIGFGITVIVGYFFARGRLLAKEIDVVRSDFNTPGGSIL